MCFVCFVFIRFFCFCIKHNFLFELSVAQKKILKGEIKSNNLFFFFFIQKQMFGSCHVWEKKSYSDIWSERKQKKKGYFDIWSERKQKKEWIRCKTKMKLVYGCGFCCGVFGTVVLKKNYLRFHKKKKTKKNKKKKSQVTAKNHAVLFRFCVVFEKSKQVVTKTTN